MKIARATHRSHRPPCIMMSDKYMQATTAGTAAMRALVNRFGTEKVRADERGFETVVMAARNTAPAGASTRTRRLSAHLHASAGGAVQGRGARVSPGCRGRSRR